MLLHTLTKKFIEVQRNILNALVLDCFTKWCDGQNIGVELRRSGFNPFYRHILCEICIFIYIFCTCV
jgi:hypothetical protein